MNRTVCLAFVAGAAVAAGCGGDGASAPYQNSGPYAAGVTTLMVNGNPVEVWYPADPAATKGKPKDSYDMRDWLPDAERAKLPDADSPRYPTDATRDVAAAQAGTRFPVVLFSHGLAGYRMQSTFLMTHLASWGFVVAAPEHPERGLKLLLGGSVPQEDKGAAQMLEALGALRSEDGTAGGRFAGRLDLTRVAAIGHSMGGGTAFAVAKDPAITAWASYATSGAVTDPPAKRALVMAGTGDEIANNGTIESNFDKLPAGKVHVGIRDAGHLAFADICAIGRDQGGILKIALDHGIMVSGILQQLGSDGCRGEDLVVEDAWPLVRHYTVAHLRLSFGIDPAPGVGLDLALGEDVFGQRLFHYRSE